MRIEELLIENHNLEEGPIWDKTKAVAGQAANVAAQGVGAAAQGVGAVAGGVRGAWDRAKQGYKKGFNAVVGTPRNGQQGADGQAGANGAPGQDGAAGGGQDPNQLRQQGKALIAQADQLEKQQKQQAPAQNAPQTTTPANSTTNSLDTPQQTAPASAEAQPASPEEQPAQGTTPPAEDPNATPTPNVAPQATGSAVGGAPGGQPATPPAGTPPKNNQAPANPKDPKAIAAATKARLQGQRAAGKSMASSTGGGFNKYVQGGGGQTMTGADKQGNPVFKQNVKREDVQFESKFLGIMI